MTSVEAVDVRQLINQQMVAGTLADCYGRRMMIILSVFFFGLWTPATALSQSIEQMMLFRFLTGLSLGAAMPNVGTLGSLFAGGQRSTLMRCHFMRNVSNARWCAAVW